MTLFTIALRNCRRNKRRTIITAASIFMALSTALIIRSFQIGVYDSIIDETIGKFSGYLQLQHPDYFYEPSIDNSIEYPKDLNKEIITIEGVKAIVPRIQTGALASSGNNSKAVFITGIDCEKEKQLSNPAHLLIHYQLTKEAISFLKKEHFWKKEFESFRHNSYQQPNFLLQDLHLLKNSSEELKRKVLTSCKIAGSYLQPNEKGVLLTDKLASFLNLKVKDSVVLIGQGYHGASAAGIFPIKGLIHSPNIELNNKLIYMPINQMREWLDLSNGSSYLTVVINHRDNVDNIQEKITLLLKDKEMLVKNWRELFPTTFQMIKSDEEGGIVIIVLLYMIIFFSIVGTIMMMMNERKKEFSVLYAIGMKKKQLKKIILLEMTLMTAMGIFLSLLLLLPIIIYFHNYPIELYGSMRRTYEEMGYPPIMPTAGMGFYIYKQLIIILIMVLGACYFPLRKINKISKTHK